MPIQTPVPAPTSSFSIDFDKIFRRLLIFILMGVAGNLIFSFLTTDDDIFTSVISFSLPYFFLALLLTWIPWFLNTFRVLIWTRFLGYNIPFLRVMKIVIGTEMGAAVSPTSVGGSPVKAGMLIQEGLSPGEAASLATFGAVEDFGFYLFFLLVIFPVGLARYSMWDFGLWDAAKAKIVSPLSLYVLLGVLVIVFVLTVFKRKVINPKLKTQRTSVLARFARKAAIAWDEFKYVYRLVARRGKLWYVLTTFITGIQWICRYSVITALVLSLGLPADPLRFLILQWFVFLSMNFVPLPGASGGAEAIFFIIYKPFLPAEAIGLITAGWRFLTFYFLLILDIFVFAGLLHLTSKPVSSEPTS
ncbi:MAG: UPF0104 family protein [Gemmatimonadetes bacterium]|nr:MAG: UPF0104 family protein [Gemmatimonadota bacterium]